MSGTPCSSNLFGTRLTARAGCTVCGEQLEIVLDVDDVRRAAPSAPGEAVRVVHDEYVVEARPPTVADVAALDRVDPVDRRDVLLDRVVRSATHRGTALAVADLPALVVADVAERLAAADPQADIRLVVCAACGHRWSAVFDIVDYLWEEVEHWALRLLREVHATKSELPAALSRSSTSTSGSASAGCRPADGSSST